MEVFPLTQKSQGAQQAIFRVAHLSYSICIYSLWLGVSVLALELKDPRLTSVRVMIAGSSYNFRKLFVHTGTHYHIGGREKIRFSMVMVLISVFLVPRMLWKNRKPKVRLGFIVLLPSRGLDQVHLLGQLKN